MTEVRPSALTSRMKSAGPTFRPKTKTPLAKNACSASHDTWHASADVRMPTDPSGPARHAQRPQPSDCVS